MARKRSFKTAVLNKRTRRSRLGGLIVSPFIRQRRHKRKKRVKRQKKKNMY